MSRPRITTGLGILVSWAAVALSSVAMAQTGSEFTGDGLLSSQGNWESRILRRGGGQPASHPNTGTAVVTEASFDLGGAAMLPGGTGMEAGLVPDPSVPPSSGMPLETTVPGATPYVPPHPAGDPAFDACGAGGPCGAYCGDYCGDCYGDYGADCCDLWSPGVGCWLRGFSLFAGFQGFKGPLDLGRNGNFGFHEGINFGAPAGRGGLGYQFGFQAVHSNLSGDQVVTVNGRPRYDDNNRDQIFLTAGLFHRAQADWDWQWAVVYDYFHDNYFDEGDLAQVRTELSLRLDACREVGYWGAYGVNTEQFSDGLRTFSVEPTDLYAFFYRRHFSGGGQGRLWAGFTGNSDAYVGGEATVPLGSSWALENGFAYLIPTETGRVGQEEEGWNVFVRLVWYPGRPAACAIRAPYQPVLDVANNGVFMVDYR